MKEYGPDTIGTVVPEAAAAAEVLDGELLIEVLEDVEDAGDVDDIEDVEDDEDTEDEEDAEAPVDDDVIFAVSS